LGTGELLPVASDPLSYRLWACLHGRRHGHSPVDGLWMWRDGWVGLDIKTRQPDAQAGLESLWGAEDRKPRGIVLLETIGDGAD